MAFPAGAINSPAVGFDGSPGTATRQADFELAKWLAVAAMVIDHYGKIVDPDLFDVTHAIGRIAFPLFATIIGMRLALRPDLAVNYVRRLLPWAIISQPVFVFVGRDWYDGNILLTLLAGVLALMLLRRIAGPRSAPVLLGLAALLPFAWYCEFSVIGAAMVPIAALLAARRNNAAILAAGPLGLAANASLAWPPLSFIDVSALLASVVLVLSVRLKLGLPRLPAFAFYGFYPAHLLVLHIIDVGI